MTIQDTALWNSASHSQLWSRDRADMPGNVVTSPNRTAFVVVIALLVSTTLAGNGRSQTNLESASKAPQLMTSPLKTVNELLEASDQSAALANYQITLDFAKSLREGDPEYAYWQHGLAVSFDRVGNILLSQGDLSNALLNYQAAWEIRVRLATSDPQNTSWQQDLSISHLALGDVYFLLDDLDHALTNYQVALNIGKRLLQADPKNASLQKPIFSSYLKIGHVHVADENIGDALVNYRAALITDGDPEDAILVRDLAWSNWRIAQRGNNPLESWGEVIRLLGLLSKQSSFAKLDKRALHKAELIFEGLDTVNK